MLTLEQVLADAREEAAVLRRHGHADQATAIEGVLDRVREAAESYLTWLNEGDAVLYSGLAVGTLRRRFRELEDAGNARWNARNEREYRQSALPRRPNVAAAREAGRRGEQAA